MRKLAALVLLVGCQGEQVSSLASDAATDSATDSPTDSVQESGTCEAVAGNLIPDGSFEETLGTKWSPTLEITTGGADHCQQWAKMITREPWAGVSIKLPLTGEKGDVYEFGASIERLDDHGNVMLSVQNDDALLQESAFATLPTKSKWVRVRGTLVLDRHVDALVVVVAANGPELRTLGIDRAYLVKK